MIKIIQYKSSFYILFYFLSVFSFIYPQNGDKNISLLKTKLSSAANDSEKISVLKEITEYYVYYDLDSAFIYAKEAYNLSKKTNYKKAEITYTLGIVYSYYNELSRSQEYFYEAFKIAKQNNNTELLYTLYAAIGINYSYMEEYGKSLEYLNKSIVYLDKYDDNNKISLLISIGQAYSNLGKFNESEEYLYKALEISKKINSKIADVYIVLGDSYLRKKDFQKSIEFYDKTIKSGVSNESLYYISALDGLFQNNLELKKYDEAVKQALVIDTLSGKLMSYDVQIKNLLSLSELYDYEGDYKSALHYANRYINLRDTLQAKQKNEQLNFLNIEFETSLKEQKIAAMEKEDKYKVILFSIIFISLILVISIMFFILKQIKQKNKILLLEKQKIQYEKELETLEKQKLRFQVYEKDREILTHILQINQQKEILTNVKEEVTGFINYDNMEEVYNSVKKLNSDILNKIKLCDDWEQIKMHFEKVHPSFFSNLREKHQHLTINELKMCSYIKLKFSIKEISRLLNITPESVKVSRSRLKKKLQIPDEVNIDEYLEIQ
ncbi:MAG: tetratricopeptide repeat protein [Ignavibacteria bacterium]|nr:tetratricopeptide repeat protein [Ignavibacteria bacterium]